MRRAHKIELYPTENQKSYLIQAMGAQRHLYNQLYFYFNDPDHKVKWSKKAARAYYHSIKGNFPWYKQFSADMFRETIDNLDNAYQHFFRRVRMGIKPVGCCGNIQSMPLSSRTYECSNCGMVMDRDLNAAINIRRKGEETRTNYSPSINPTVPEPISHSMECVDRYESVDTPVLGVE